MRPKKRGVFPGGCVALTRAQGEAVRVTQPMGGTKTSNKHHMKTRISIFTAAIFAAFISTTYAGPGPGTWPTGFPTHVKTKAEAESCCKPGEKVALACKDCKTSTEKDGEKDKKGIMSWFAPDDKHDCSGCGGKITLKGNPASKAPQTSEYTRTCSKCGDKSAYTCATHKKS